MCQARRKLRTARTRRCESGVSSRPSLLEDLRHVRLDGPLGDEEPLGDGLIREALRDEPQDLAFARGELGQRIMAALRPMRRATIVGSTTVSPSQTRRRASTSMAGSTTRSLSR